MAAEDYDELKEIRKNGLSKHYIQTLREDLQRLNEPFEGMGERDRTVSRLLTYIEYLEQEVLDSHEDFLVHGQFHHKGCYESDDYTGEAVLKEDACLVCAKALESSPAVLTKALSEEAEEEDEEFDPDSVENSDRRASLRIILERCSHSDKWASSDRRREIEIKDPSTHAVRLITKKCDVLIRAYSGNLQFTTMGRPMSLGLPRGFTFEGDGLIDGWGPDPEETEE